MERNKVEEMRDSLRILITQLRDLQSDAGVVETFNTTRPVFLGDDIDWEGSSVGPNAIPSATSGQSEFVYPDPELYLNEVNSNIENMVLCLPSNNNTGGLYKQTELELRIAQAESHLHHLQELIADKSFHFSELIRSGNRPDVRTRARTAMLQMNGKIAFHARTYNQVRGRMITLGADNMVLEDYKLLEKMDTKSSTAILDFNRPGSSTNIKLSWIWQSVRTRLGPDLDNPNFVPPTDPGAMLECEWPSHFICTIIESFCSPTKIM